MTRKRSSAEDGYTLIELMIVVTIISILITLPIASYLSYRDAGNRAVARANVKVIVPTIEGYFAEHATYVGLTLLGLKAGYDQSIDSSVYTLNAQTEMSYCVSSTVGGQSWKKAGPGAVVEPGACA
jgi:prepilin-type N-terminal cleavage/methylation domain-containing protein